MVNHIVADEMTEISFEEQRRIFCNELFKAFDYIDYDKYGQARRAIYTDEWNDKILREIMLKASYNGSLVRISYYKFVHKRRFDARALMDAVVKIYIMHSVLLFDFDGHLRDPDVKKAIKETRWPEWTKFGLIGGSMKQLIKLGEEFCDYMDGSEAD